MLSLGFLPSQEISELQKSPSNSSRGSAADVIFLPRSGLIVHFLKATSLTLVLNAFLKLFPPVFFRTLRLLVYCYIQTNTFTSEIKRHKKFLVYHDERVLSFTPQRSDSPNSLVTLRPLHDY